MIPYPILVISKLLLPNGRNLNYESTNVILCTAVTMYVEITFSVVLMLLFHKDSSVDSWMGALVSFTITAPQSFKQTKYDVSRLVDLCLYCLSYSTSVLSYKDITDHVWQPTFGYNIYNIYKTLDAPSHHAEWVQYFV